MTLHARRRDHHRHAAGRRPGHEADPVYLKPGDVMRLGIDDLGEQRQTRLRLGPGADRRLKGIARWTMKAGPGPVIRIHPADDVVIARAQLRRRHRLDERRRHASPA